MEVSLKCKKPTSHEIPDTGEMTDRGKGKARRSGRRRHVITFKVLWGGERRRRGLKKRAGAYSLVAPWRARMAANSSWAFFTRASLWLTRFCRSDISLRKRSKRSSRSRSFALQIHHQVLRSPFQGHTLSINTHTPSFLHTALMQIPPNPTPSAPKGQLR